MIYFTIVQYRSVGRAIVDRTVIAAENINAAEAALKELHRSDAGLQVLGLHPLYYERRADELSAAEECRPLFALHSVSGLHCVHPNDRSAFEQTAEQLEAFVLASSAEGRPFGALQILSVLAGAIGDLSVAAAAVPAAPPSS